MKAELIRLGWVLEKTHDLRKLFGELDVRKSDLTPALRPLVTGYTELYFMSRYPGFDLEDPVWPTLRQEVKDAENLLSRIKARA